MDRLVQIELGVIDERRVALRTLRVDCEVPEVDAQSLRRRELQPARGAFERLWLVLAGIVLVVGCLIFERHEACCAFVYRQRLDSRRSSRHST